MRVDGRLARALGARSDDEDLLQTVALTVLLRIWRQAEPVAFPRVWIKRSANWAARDVFRKRARQRRVELLFEHHEPTPPRSPEAAFSLKEQFKKLDTLLAGKHTRALELLRLEILEGRSRSEAAARLEVSHGAADQLVSRLRKRLRELRDALDHPEK